MLLIVVYLRLKLKAREGEHNAGIHFSGSRDNGSDWIGKK